MKSVKDSMLERRNARPNGAEDGRPRDKRRSPLVAMTLSGVFPGLGQLYNGQRRKGLLFIVGGMATAFGPLNPLTVDIDLSAPAAGLEKVLLFSLPFLLVALWSVVDAFRAARRPSTS